MRGFVLFVVRVFTSGNRLEFVTRDGIEGVISRSRASGYLSRSIALQENRSMCL
jgi:hypothetical protein